MATNGWALMAMDWSADCSEKAMDAGDGWASMCKGWGGGAAMDDFKSVEESAAKSGASDPGGVAYAVGVKKYGKEGMEAKAEAGK